MLKNPLTYFDHIAIINLKTREDRLKETLQELKKLDLKAPSCGIEIFPAICPKEKEDWPSIGAKGCFLSHYTLLKKALDQKIQQVLILEDDVHFLYPLPLFWEDLISKLSQMEWGFAYFGHIDPFKNKDKEIPLGSWIQTNQPLVQAHCYAVHSSTLSRLVTFLEQVMKRSGQDPLGGPQHFDGALNMFREQNKDIITLLAHPNLAKQRSSRSDITCRFFDRIPIFRHLLSIYRKIKKIPPFEWKS